MRVERGRSAGAAPATRTVAPGGGSFSIDQSAAHDGARPVAPGGTLHGVGALLGLQEVGSGLNDRAARETAAGILDRLEEVSRGLLLGHIGRDTVTQLASRSAGLAARAADPRLREILEEINLRAQVELAKLDRP